MGVFRQAHGCGVEAKLLVAFEATALALEFIDGASPATQQARRSKLGEFS